MLTDYAQLMDRALAAGLVSRCALAGAADDHALEAVFAAQECGFVEPVLIGDEHEVNRRLAGLGLSGRPYRLVPCPEQTNPARIAVQLVHTDQADFILKGAMQTRDLLRPILDKQTGLNDSGFITHFGLMQLRTYHKLLVMSDAVVIPHPSLNDKARIIEICVRQLHKLGVPHPVVAALCAVEDVSPKMPETVDAAELARRSEAGEFGSALVIGPISYDLATSKESAEIKGYANPYAGEVDMLLVPQLVTGNVMSKIWNADPANILGGCLVGARVPVALTSRSAQMNEKLHSLLLCALLGAAEPIGDPK